MSQPKQIECVPYKCNYRTRCVRLWLLNIFVQYVFVKNVIFLAQWRKNHEATWNNICHRHNSITVGCYMINKSGAERCAFRRELGVCAWMAIDCIVTWLMSMRWRRKDGRKRGSVRGCSERDIIPWWQKISMTCWGVLCYIHISDDSSWSIR